MRTGARMGHHAEQTAVIVAVPEAEPVVGRYRAAYDQAAGWGVGAHVTVLFPFVPPDALDATALADLAAAVASVPRFTAELTAARWFDDRVLWLAPEPGDRFRALTAAVWARFPACPPYEGRHAEVIPHLTVGDSAPVERLRAAQAAIEPLLPVRFAVTTARLIRGRAAPDSWTTVAELPLGAPRPAL
ncbi:2'-5' RNA ligase family protein [Dactylosporangium sp. NPDC048998]|uniref:2'-5' RNA ligase family protein n=1 Tax=Dactylosporangium sp. NPDC048998 TaxID=3363976 RepID=UPI00371896E3